MVKTGKRHVLYSIAAFLLIIVGIYLYDYNMSMLVLAFLLTILVPSSTTLWVYGVLSNKERKSYSIILLYYLMSSLTYLVSGCFLWLAMSTFDFRIGFVTYKMAILSYILPLIIILISVLKMNDYRFADVKKALFNKKVVSITIITIFLLYIYLSRSGNYSLFSATPLELQIRMLLEENFLVRPRAKELLLGYPCMFLLFLIDRQTHKTLFIYLLLGSAIIGISVLNTFCHSFTPINVSLMRVILGFLLGTLTALTTYILVKFIAKDYFLDKTYIK